MTTSNLGSSQAAKNPNPDISIIDGHCLIEVSAKNDFMWMLWFFFFDILPLM